jgi:hypothetical protein
MGLGEEPSREMDVAHHNVPVHVEVGDPARGFGSFLRVLVSQLELGPDRGVPVSIDVRDRPGEVPDREVVLQGVDVSEIKVRDLQCLSSV